VAEGGKGNIMGSVGVEAKKSDDKMMKMMNFSFNEFQKKT
jgi:hypothetical protein